MVKKTSSKSASKDTSTKDILTKRRISNNAEDKSIKEKVKSSRKLPNQKVIYMEIDDEITTITDRLKRIKIKNILLVVPKKALLFQSVINLKILKRKIDDMDKTLTIITQDSNGLKLCNRLGIKVMEKMERTDGGSAHGNLKDSAEMMPLKAAVNSVEEATPSRLKQKKIALQDLIQKKGEKITRATEKPKDNKKSESFGDKLGNVFNSPSKHAVLALILVSVLTLGAISYVALPGATVHLKPKSSSISVQANITLADYQKNKAELDTRPPKTIAYFPVTTKYEKVFTYNATGKLAEGSVAQGMITIKNSSGNDWPLVAATRFKTADGIIYRLQTGVTVPAARGGKNGELKVKVVADLEDENKQVVGEKSNIKAGTLLTIPGLSSENQKRIFAEAAEDFKGGNTNFSKFISKDDLAAAKSKMIEELRNSAREELKLVLAKKNESQNTNLVLLATKDREDIVVIGEPKVTIDPSLEGKKQETFEVRGEVSADGVAYSRDELLNVLKAELRLKKNPEKRLVKIDDESVNFDNMKVVDFDKSSKKIKITPSIAGTEEYELNPDKENGERLLKKIREHVSGKEISEARSFLQELPEIEKVSIDVWPAWAPTMPTVAENIRIDVNREQP